MNEMHLFILGFILGSGSMWGVLAILHKYSMKQIEQASTKALEDLGKSARDAIEDLAKTVADSLKK